MEAVSAGEEAEDHAKAEVAAVVVASIEVIEVAVETIEAGRVQAPVVQVIGPVRPVTTTTLPTDKNVTDVRHQSRPALTAAVAVPAVAVEEDLTTMAAGIMMTVIEAEAEADLMVLAAVAVAAGDRIPEKTTDTGIEAATGIETEAIEITGVTETEAIETGVTEIGTEKIGIEIKEAAAAATEAADPPEAVMRETETTGGPDLISSRDHLMKLKH